MRLSVGSTDVHTGNSVYFDSLRQTIGPEHIMASGALPPGFAADRDRRRSLLGRWHRIQLAAMVRARRFAGAQCADHAGRPFQRPGPAAAEPRPGARARQGHPVLEQDAVQHHPGRRSSRASAPRSVACSTSCRPRLRGDPDFQLLAPLCHRRHHITIVHLINRRSSYSSSDKDYLFSRAEVRQLWEAGLEDVRRSCAHPQWRKRDRDRARRSRLRSRRLTDDAAPGSLSSQPMGLEWRST